MKSGSKTGWLSACGLTDRSLFYALNTIRIEAKLRHRPNGLMVKSLQRIRGENANLEKRKKEREGKKGESKSGKKRKRRKVRKKKEEKE